MGRLRCRRPGVRGLYVRRMTVSLAFLSVFTAGMNLLRTTLSFEDGVAAPVVVAGELVASVPVEY